MSILNVLKEPTKSLRIPSVPVDVSKIGSPTLNALIVNMKETMVATNGVGIAAPQVGVNERVIIVEMKGGAHAFVNPEIISRSPRLVDSEEGCLSIPGVFGIVKRSRSITVRATTPDGIEQTMKVTGFPAIIFQHEIDHLDGVLFIDRAERMTTPQTAL